MHPTHGVRHRAGLRLLHQLLDGCHLQQLVPVLDD
jgi:hypothetical protein